MALKMHPSLAVHAGEWLRSELVKPAGLTQAALASHLGLSRQAVSAILNGRASLTASTAIRFEKAFGVRADTLMRMQAAYDMAQARAHESEIHVTPLVAA
jgi:addiction module HigA family antidote